MIELVKDFFFVRFEVEQLCSDVDPSRVLARLE